MEFERLRIRGVRCLADVSLELGPGFNVLVGENGAGKTSVLEAAFLLSHGRSFRAGGRDVLRARDGERLEVFAQVRSRAGTLHRLGVGRCSGRWEVRVDGEDAPALSALFEHVAVVCFEPGSHALIAGPGEERRRFLDWGVFHVEHEFLSVWRRYQRALRQRNQLLRAARAAEDALLDAWEVELAEAGELIDGWRAGYVERWEDALRRSAALLLPELGAVTVNYRRGWPVGERLGEALVVRRDRDRGRGHTTVGAHRADWSVGFVGAPQREHFSRGQEKLCALACVLAQSAVFAEVRGEWPVVCLDDLASELDDEHQRRVVDALAEQGAQILVTGTAAPESLLDRECKMFHVEQGRVEALL